MPFTTTQLQALKTAIQNETDTEFVGYRNAGETGQMALWFNGNSTFVVWKTKVTLNEIGDKINGTELEGLASLPMTRLQTIALFSPLGVNPSLADRRAFFDGVFSGAGGVNTRAALLALWKRFAKRGEKVFATGTGSDAVPGTLVFEGNITNQDVIDALAVV